MQNLSHISKLWWVLPDELSGMPQPTADDLSTLYDSGIRAVVSLLEENVGLDNYEAHDFSSKWIPVADDGAPTFKQIDELVGFVDQQLAQNCPVAIHCKGGKGRTGTMLAAYLIAKGASYDDAMKQIDKAKPNAIKKDFQIDFLKQLSSSA